MSKAFYVGTIGTSALLAFTFVGLAVTGKLTPRQSVSQGQAVVAVTRNASVPSDEGKADASVAPFQALSAGLRDSVLAQPLPEISLVFPAQHRQTGGTFGKKLALPYEARKPLTSCWLAYLAYYYRIEIERESDPQSRSDNDNAMISITEDTAADLEKLVIDAPNGRRNISHNEARDVAYFLGRAAAGVVKEAKQAQE